jgi:hypothetical protein
LSDVIVIPEGAHSPLGPSSSERWLNCGGGIGNGQTEYAAEGTAAHALSEWVRNEGKPVEHWKGKILKVGDFEFKVGKAMMDSVRTFVESVTELPGAALVEERVHYEELVPGGFGTLDDGRLHKDTAVITDFKFGRGVEVDVKGNSQLKLYDLGVFFKLDWLYKFKKFINRISQPRRGVVAEVEVEEINTGHLLQWGYDVIRPRAELLLAGKLQDQLKAGPWCRFCGKKDSCSVRAAYKLQYERSPDSPRDALVNLETSEDPFV